MTRRDKKEAPRSAYLGKTRTPPGPNFVFTCYKCGVKGHKANACTDTGPDLRGPKNCGKRENRDRTSDTHQPAHVYFTEPYDILPVGMKHDTYANLAHADKEQTDKVHHSYCYSMFTKEDDDVFSQSSDEDDMLIKRIEDGDIHHSYGYSMLHVRQRYR